MSAPCVELTVDRIEDGWAVVEWCGAVVSDVPLVALPVSVAEGDRVRFIVRGGRPRPGRVVSASNPTLTRVDLAIPEKTNERHPSAVP
jgi:hypothetical protein